MPHLANKPFCAVYAFGLRYDSAGKQLEHPESWTSLKPCKNCCEKHLVEIRSISADDDQVAGALVSAFLHESLCVAKEAGESEEFQDLVTSVYASFIEAKMKETAPARPTVKFAEAESKTEKAGSDLTGEKMAEKKETRGGRFKRCQGKSEEKSRGSER